MVTRRKKFVKAKAPELEKVPEVVEVIPEPEPTVKEPLLAPPPEPIVRKSASERVAVTPACSICTHYTVIGHCVVNPKRHMAYGPTHHCTQFTEK